MIRFGLILLCIAFAIGIAILMPAASAGCSSCMQEGDWSESANKFIEGKPIDDTPKLFGPKAEREKNSQVATNTAGTKETVSDMPDTSTTSTPAIEFRLTNVSAKPSFVNSGSPVIITAVFQEKISNQSENLTETDKIGTSTIGNEILLTSTASIINTDGAQIGTVNLIKSSGNEYSGTWKADVPAGTYSVNLAASSLQSSQTFLDVLRIEVIAGADAAQNVTSI